MTSRRRVILGGVSLVVATILFALVFSYLAARFDYPTVLARSAGEVLPALLALGPVGRAIWFLYGLIPLLLVPTARGIEEASRLTAPGAGRATVWCAVIGRCDDDWPSALADIQLDARAGLSGCVP